MKVILEDVLKIKRICDSWESQTHYEKLEDVKLSRDINNCLSMEAAELKVNP